MSVRIFNPDGSEAEKSGNGLRITVCHAFLEHGAPERFSLRTLDRANDVAVLSRNGPVVVSEVDIGRPSFSEPGRVRIDTAAGSVDAVLVSVGNPHCVVFGEEVSRERCLELGPQLENHSLFPQRTNVQLVEVLSRDRARIEIWERGAGYTLASGTSAAAVAAALMRDGLADAAVTIVMPGGELSVRQDSSGSLVQSGPARRVYRATIDVADFS
jgi:diaminopimelate epimerase